MRHVIKSQLIALLTLTCASALVLRIAAQVQGTDLRAFLSGMEQKAAGGTFSDPAYRLHYELSADLADGTRVAGTYDRLHLTAQTLRTEIAFGSYHFLLIREAIGPPSIFRSGVEPLRMREFTLAFPTPKAEAFGVVRGWSFAQSDKYGKVRCLTDHSSQRLCSDDETGLPIEASLGGTRFVYSDWRPIGAHWLPMKILIMYKDKELLTATGSLSIPTQESFLGGKGDTVGLEKTPETNHHVEQRLLLKERRFSEPFGASSGFVLLAVDVTAEGKVLNSRVLDSDDKKLEASALDQAHDLKYAPQGSGDLRKTDELHYLYRGSLQRIQQGDKSFGPLQELEAGPRLP